MKKTELYLETVTPMFLRGADNKTPELRPPSFKALFRYWWRTVQDCDTDSLRKEEAKWFGSTDRKSPFSLRIPGTTDLNIVEEKLLQHKSGNQGNPMDAYDIKQPFSLDLITKNKSNTCYYQQIAKLGFLLGGVGNRSRRGFGSIRETCWDFKDISDLRTQVLDTLNAVAKTDRFKIDLNFLINGRTVTTIKPIKSPSNSKYPVIQRIFFGEQTYKMNDLLRIIGQESSNAKRYNTDDTLGGGVPRMASPIVVRIQMVGSEYIPVVTQLCSPYPNYAGRYYSSKPTDITRKQMNFINAIIK